MNRPRAIFTLLVLLCVFAAAGAVHAGEGIADARAALENDINDKSAELGRLRDKIGAERTELAATLATLRAEVAALRDSKTELVRMRGLQSGGYGRMKDDIAATDADIESCLDLVLEDRRERSTRMTPAHVRRYKTELGAVDALLSSEAPDSGPKAAGLLLALCEKADIRRIGLDVFKGECANRNGEIYGGVFVTAGPCAWFCSIEKGFGGIIDLLPGSLYPAIAEKMHFLILKRLISGEPENLPMDFTGGRATRVADAYDSLLGHLRAGGLLVIPILALGIICLVGTVLKVGRLSHLRVRNDRELQEIITLVNKGHAARAFKKAQALGEPMGPVLTEGINVHSAAREHLEEIMHEKILLQIPTLERFLPFLSVAASSAPLLGLLGTVTGMIRTFNLLTLFGAGKTQLLSEGISEALITTELGLIVAIPSLLFHAFLARKVKGVIRTMEQTALAFINGVKIKDANGNGETGMTAE